MKAAALLLASSMALVACASDEPSGNGNTGAGGTSEGGEAQGEPLQIGLAYDVGGRGDRSFNDSAFAGAQAAADELGGEVRELSPNADASNRTDLLTQLADEGYNPIIAVGFAYGPDMAAVAEQYPDVNFAIVDSSVAEIGADNLTGLLFAEEQGSFLAGVAAALKTEADHVGFVGGVDTGLIQKFQAGFEAGVAAVDENIEVDVQYITPDGDFSGFTDPARGQILAQGMYDGGADIVYHAAGASGTGVFQAAAESQGLAIGVDSDQYETVDDPALKEVIMTSMLKRVDNAVQGFITGFSEGDVPGGEDVVNDLSTEGVGLSTSGGQIDDILPDIEEFQQQIIDGEIEVPTTPSS
jgi:basic membrane lipoprotein Med (substrate-binding protein (PBP1-ABC) superfamily)